MAVRHVFTGTGHGDLAVGGEPSLLAARRAAVPGVPAAPWVWLRQVHGAEVVVAGAPGDRAGEEADAVVTVSAGVPVAVHTADCGPLLVEGVGGLAVVHAGWRGLRAGVVAAAIGQLRALGVEPTVARLGPTIRARCYEFAGPELSELAERFGPQVVGTTAWGTDALDLPAAIAAAVGEHGIDLVDDGTCTACSPVHWSHRARGDSGRQALVAWLDHEADGTPGGVGPVPPGQVTGR